MYENYSTIPYCSDIFMYAIHAFSLGISFKFPTNNCFGGPGILVRCLWDVVEDIFHTTTSDRTPNITTRSVEDMVTESEWRKEEIVGSVLNGLVRMCTPRNPIIYWPYSISNRSRVSRHFTNRSGGFGVCLKTYDVGNLENKSFCQMILLFSAQSAVLYE